MARYTGPTCKLARREGVDLGLKSPARGLESKCKLGQAPGQHGAGRRQRLSDYATCSCAKNRKYAVLTVFWKSSSVTTTRRLRARKARRVKTC